MNGPNAATSAPLLALSVFGQQECGCSTNLQSVIVNRPPHEFGAVLAGLVLQVVKLLDLLLREL